MLPGSFIRIFKLLIVLQVIFILDICSGVTISELNVPALADPRDPLVLGCTFDLGGEELHSVKWYKDEQEFFRYTPRQQPHVMSFPVAGVHLDKQQAGMACDARLCSVRLTRLSTAHSGGAYKCEVSTEAPKFHVGFRAGNVTVAAVGRAEPQVQGVRGAYTAGDLVQASCTAAAADPAPLLQWLINGVPVLAAASGSQRLSAPDQHGLVVASRDLRFLVERRLFASADHLLHVVCVAAPPPGIPAKPLSSLTATARLIDSQAFTHLEQRNQPLEWNYGKAADQSFHQGLLYSLVLVTFCWR